MSSLVTGELIIGAADVGVGERKLTAFDPATGETLEPRFFAADKTQVERACALAWTAFDPYRNLSRSRRADFLVAIGEEIMALGDDLLARTGLETGLPPGRLVIERGRTVNQLNLFAEGVRSAAWLDLRVDEALPERTPARRPDLRMRQIPVGPVAVFGSSNFPLAFSVAGGDSASALAAGCPLIVKGHPAHLGTGEMVARAVRAAAARTGMPEGVFSYLPGEIATGVALVQDPRIKAVGFTGSRSGGLAILALAAARPEPIPVYAEMSSVNPVFLLPAAMKARAGAIAKGFAASLTLGAGQFCTNPGLVFALEGSDLDAFLGQLETELGAHQPQPMLTSGIHKAFETGRNALAGHDGVILAAAGGEPGSVNRGQAIVFSVDVERFLANERLAHEIFGAAALVVRCTSPADMIRAAEQLEGQLTASLQMGPEDAALAGALLPVLERKAGRILANDWPTGVEVSHAMVHGGPYPATSDSHTTSVGTLAIRRFQRPVCYQDIPTALLPEELQPEVITSLPHLMNGAPIG